jgi:hypothetical protein
VSCRQKVARRFLTLTSRLPWTTWWLRSNNRPQDPQTKSAACGAFCLSDSFTSSAA